MNNYFNYNELIKSIPNNCSNIQNTKLLNNGYNEWRWRILNINNNIKVEISYYNLRNKRRLYKNKKGDWVHRNIPSEYDNFVVESYFYYTSD